MVVTLLHTISIYHIVIHPYPYTPTPGHLLLCEYTKTQARAYVLVSNTVEFILQFLPTLLGPGLASHTHGRVGSPREPDTEPLERPFLSIFDVRWGRRDVPAG